MKIDISGLNLLTILFVGLKLTNHIDWSWWWVLSPTLLLIALAFLFLLLGFVVGFIRVMNRK
jgi:hypothetical protein